MAFKKSVTTISLLFAGALAVQGLDAPKEKDIEFFEKRIRPIFADRCQKCHGPDRTEANLRVDSYDGIMEGGVSGDFVVPRKPDDSLLLTAVSYQNEDLQMPPDSKLPKEEIEDLRQWVQQGAPHPDAPKK